MKRKKKGSDELSIELLSRMAEVLKLLAHAYRLKIVEFLSTHDAAPVHEIVEALGLPQAVVSHHLSKLRQAGLTEAERRGREVWYRIVDPSALTILDCIRKKARKS
jgi:DNA-binding transcriptional ArsR family regulator